MKLHFLNTAAIFVGLIICGSLQANDMRVELKVPMFPAHVWIDLSTKDSLPENFAQDIVEEEFTNTLLNELFVIYQEHINDYKENQAVAPSLEKDITKEIQVYAKAHDFKIDSAVLHAESYNPNLTTVTLDNGAKIIFAAKNTLTADQIESLIDALAITIEKNFEFIDLKATLEQTTDITSKNAVEKAESTIIKKYAEVETAQNNFSKVMLDYEVFAFQIIDAE